MRECRTSGSVRRVLSNGHPYRNRVGLWPRESGPPLKDRCLHIIKASVFSCAIALFLITPNEPGGTEGINARSNQPRDGNLCL